MSESPYIPFYTSDFLGGTSGMTAATKGVYITLLCLMYEAERPLHQKWEALARRCGCTLPAFKKAVSDLEDDGKIFSSDDGLWSEKCDKHLALRRERSDSARSAAKKRWQKSEQNQRQPDASASLTQCQPEPEPEPYEESNDSSSRQGELLDADERTGENDAAPDHDPETVETERRRAETGSGGGAPEGDAGDQPDRPPDRPKPPAKGTRIASDFWPDGTTQRVFAECGGVDLGAWTEQFVDYWSSRSGQQATKRDWQATARNRIRQCAANGWAEPGLPCRANGRRGGHAEPPGRADLEMHFAAAARVGSEWEEEIDPMGTAEERSGGMGYH